MSYATYDSYRDSGVAWLGDVPGHWEVKRLKFAINNVSEKIDAQSSELRYFGLENIQSFTGKLLDDVELISEGVAHLFQKDDVLFGKLRPYLSKVYLSEQSGLVSTEALVFRSQSKILPKFLFYYCLSPDFIDVVNGTTFGSKMPRASWDDIGNLKAILPPLPEQTAIVAYLDSQLSQIDALIGKQQSLLEKLAEQRTAIITHAVTKGLNAHAPMKNSGVAWLGEVPAHWRVIKLGYTLLNLRTGLNPRSNFELNTSDAENYYVTIQELVNDSIKFTDNTDKINDEALKIINNRSALKIGDILLSGTGTIGKTALISETPKNWNIKEGVYALTPNLNSVSSSFLLRLFHAKYLLNQMDTLAMGSTVRSVKMADLKFIKIVLPPLPEQTAIADYLDEQTANIDRLSNTVNQTIASLKEYRSALITQAVTGKIKVV